MYDLETNKILEILNKKYLANVVLCFQCKVGELFIVTVNVFPIVENDAIINFNVIMKCKSCCTIVNMNLKLKQMTLMNFMTSSGINIDNLTDHLITRLSERIKSYKLEKG